MSCPCLRRGLASTATSRCWRSRPLRGETIRMADAAPRVTASASGLDLAGLVDGRRDTIVALPAPKAGQPQHVQLEFARPFQWRGSSSWLARAPATSAVRSRFRMTGIPSATSASSRSARRTAGGGLGVRLRAGRREDLPRPLHARLTAHDGETRRDRAHAPRIESTTLRPEPSP